MGEGAAHPELDRVGATAERPEEVGAMPGILMDDSSLNGAKPLNENDLRVNGLTPMDVRDVVNGKGKLADGLANGMPQLDGPAEYRNGALVNGKTSSPQLPAQAPPSAMDSFGQLPPEIEHITFGYLPLSKLITRLVQESFNDLTQVIEDMSAMQLPQPAPTTNPNHLHNQPGDAASNTLPVNVQKKSRLLNFAQDRRAQFIKLLVLSQWSRQAGNVSKAIDLKVWLDRQRALYDEAGWWMGELKRNLGQAKMPNPDLKTALEVLSTGKASWLPDVGQPAKSPISIC